MADPRLLEGHAGHDAARIVAWVDEALDPADRADVDAQVAGCRSCARLADDLRDLKAATSAVPPVPRTRDFRLSAADVATLTADAPSRATAEPPVTSGRPGPLMTPTTTPAPSLHADHDPELIAASVDALVGASTGAMSEVEQERIAQWLATCEDCVDLRVDLLAIARANRALPTPARPREYALDAADASRLRSPWRRLLDAIGTSRDQVSRPLAYGLTTLGLAGILLGSGIGLPMGSAASAGATTEMAAPELSAAAAAPAPSAAAPDALPQGGPDVVGEPDQGGKQPVQPDETGREVDGSGPEAGTGEADGTSTLRMADSGPDGTVDLSTPASGPSTIVLVSLGLLAAGALVFVLRMVARRS